MLLGQLLASCLRTVWSYTIRRVRCPARANRRCPNSRPRVPASSIGLRISMLITRRVPPATTRAGRGRGRAPPPASGSGRGRAVGGAARGNYSSAPRSARFVTTSTITSTSTAHARRLQHRRSSAAQSGGAVGVPGPSGDDAGLEPAGRADLRHVVGDVPAAGAHRDRQPARDRLVLLALGHQPQDRGPGLVELGVVAAG